MLRKERLTEQEIEYLLKVYKNGQIFGLQIGINMISVAVFSWSITAFVIVLVLNNNIPLAWSIIIFMVTGICSFIIPAIACFKNQAFEKIFPYVAVAVALLTAIKTGSGELITQIVLYTVLGIIYLIKKQNAADFRNLLSKKEKFVFTGFLIYTVYENKSTTIRNTQFYRDIIVKDGDKQMIFTISAERLLGLYGAGKKINFDTLKNKKVEVFYLDPDQFLSIKECS